MAPRLRATSLYHWATSDASAPQPVLVIRDVTVEPELSSAVLTLTLGAVGAVVVETCGGNDGESDSPARKHDETCWLSWFRIGRWQVGLF